MLFGSYLHIIFAPHRAGRFHFIKDKHQKTEKMTLLFFSLLFVKYIRPQHKSLFAVVGFYAAYALCAVVDGFLSSGNWRGMLWYLARIF